MESLWERPAWVARPFRAATGGAGQASGEGNGAMVSMSNIWDQTVEVLRGRSGILTRIAIPAIFLPAVVRDGWTAFSAPASTTPQASFGIVGSVLGFVAALLMIWGQLAVTAVATDPAVTQSEAAALASRRYAPALGVYVFAGLVLVLLALPIVIALAGSGIDLTAMASGVAPTIAPARIGFVAIYSLVLFVALILVAVRLFLLTPVIVNERAGLRSFARSWSLTGGNAWRILGIYILFTLVWIVVQGAATFVVGSIARLLIGPDAPQLVAFIVALIGAVATTAYSVVLAVFAAQLYAAVSGRRAADVFA